MAHAYPMPAKAQKVRLISKQGESALIEWHDGRATQRAYVPVGQLQQPRGAGYRSNEFLVRAPERGAPYGLPWADLIDLTVTPEEVEVALHQFGVWTAEDVERNHAQALAALQSLYARDVVSLISSARDYRVRTNSAHEESNHG